MFKPMNFTLRVSFVVYSHMSIFFSIWRLSPLLKASHLWLLAVMTQL
jgi:hypothetical protein